MNAREQATKAMKRAWTIRKAVAVECGCKVSEVVFSLCLVQAWREIKAMQQDFSELNGVKKEVAGATITVKYWEKGENARLYFHDSTDGQACWDIKKGDWVKVHKQFGFRFLGELKNSFGLEYK